MRWIILTSIVGILLFGACSKTSQQNEPVEPDMTAGFVELDSARLYYEQTGAGPDVIFIHGAFLDRTSWEPQIKAFSSDYRVTCYDVRGHGKTEAGEIQFSDSHDLKILMDSLEIEKAHLVGLSMGGGIALDYASQYPDRIGGLILVGPGIGGGTWDSELYTAYVQELTPHLQAEDFEEINATMLKYWSIGPDRDEVSVDQAFLDTMRSLMDRNRQRWYLNGLVQRLDPPVMEVADQIGNPILIINGTADLPDIHTNSATFAERAPNVSIEEVEDAGHIVNLEKPAQFNELAQKFLGSL